LATDPFLNVVELYAGTARSWEPFRAWNRCRLALLVDIDKHAKQTYLLNHPLAPYKTGDLAKMSPSKVQRLAGGRVDVLLGCPPCQGFSDTGSRDADDSRNAHLQRFGLMAAALRPLVVALENVPAVAGSTQFSAFRRQLEEAGYVWSAGLLNAALWGSCQCRHRLILVAARRDLGVEPKFPAQPTHGGARLYYNYATATMTSLESHPVAMLGLTPAAARLRETLPYQEIGFGQRPIPYVSEVIDGLPPTSDPSAECLSHFRWAHGTVMRRRMRRVAEGAQWRGGKDHFSHSYGRLHRLGLARTITTFFPNAGSGRYWHPTENRALSLREAARIQGFPDDFCFPKKFPSMSATLVGNALDSALASVTYEAIRACLE
jgi:DNA (cytosine-5)-methyltransferase 1